MPAISKIRLTNIVYEDGDKRFNDDTFLFDGHNGAILLENGGGKTVFIHTVLQAILPHTDLGERKIRETLKLDQAPAHIAIEWILNDRPRRYLVTAVSLFINNERLESYRYAFEYEHDDPDRIENMPFAIETDTHHRPAYKEEISEYYSRMKEKSMSARTFDTLRSFHEYIETNYHIIHNEWESIVKINEDEGGIEKFFERCKTTTDLYDRLLIPIVEDSITGHEKHTFADTFEKQRTAFQTYRNLQKNMEEHEAIQRELKLYVGEFKQYSEQQAAYTTAKQHAKGLMETIVSDRVTMEKQQTENEQDFEVWEKDEERHQMKRASFHILKERDKARKLEMSYLEKLGIRDETKEQLESHEKRYYSLQHAKAKQAVTKYKQLKDQYEQEIDRHAAESDIENLEEKLAEENAKLHGYFLTLIEQLEKQINETKIERRPLEESVATFQDEKKQVTEERNKLGNRFNRVLGLIESKEGDLHRLKQTLANPEQENMETEFNKWTERQQWLDEEIIRLNQWNKAAIKKVSSMESDQQQLQKQKHEMDMKIQSKQYEEKQMQRAHDQLMNKLAEVRPNWQTIDDLHLQEARVAGTLHDLQTKLQREREKLLTKERLSRRFVDDYGEQDLFVSDAYLGERLKSWQSDLYVVSGTEFYENLSEMDKENYAHYSLWPLTLVTTEAEREKLLANLMEITERLQYPIAVLTLEQVKQLGDGEMEETWIAPNHWKANVDREQFDLWKNELQAVAKETTQKRIEKETELDHHSAILRQFNDFFKTYPREKTEQLKEEIRKATGEKEHIGRKIVELAKQITNIEREIAATQEQVATFQDEMQGLAGKIEKGLQYFQVERELKELVNERTELEQKVGELDRKTDQLSREIERYETEINTLNDEIRSHELTLEVQKSQSLYKEVNTVQPIYTDDEEAVITERRRNIELQIQGIQQSYGELVAKYNQAKIDIAREQQTMKDLLDEPVEIDLDMTYPVDGERIIRQTRERINEAREKVQSLTEKVGKAKSDFDRQDAQVDQTLQQFRKRFSRDDLYTFDLAVTEIDDYLNTEQKKLFERKTYIQSEKNRIERELSDIEAAQQQLDKYSIAHHFNSTVLSAIPLTESERTEFSYARMTFAENMTRELEATNQKLERANERIENAKSRFRRFINREITEPKLREMAREGIEVKTTYEDIVDHQANMLKTLESADRYARDFISQNDELVQAFITNIHIHLTTVVEQLKVIPRHTRVRIGDQWREIYRFNIPEWTEEEGKSRIRDYMDWILEQLESDRFKDDQGLEDTGKIRKEIETWLDTRQLLQVVMEHKTMQVSCRKVTNDNKVSKRLTTWEQSNRWSGGEKWSKNMTLFLGILNFVAEKQQHLNKNTKRHRAVILDNPFGKASSDHVLSPVFFIAEQLGFQIIALTAHADGKFLQDYFPIIYSLRLRTASDGRKQVMGKTKSLHHAYFQDHDPVVVERLEEREQMQLF